MNNLTPILHDSALAWATTYYQTDKVVVVIIREDDDEPERYLALIAAANQSGWQAARPGRRPAARWRDLALVMLCRRESVASIV
ncbi:MAG: hypothetical protein IPH82_20535 [Chloroflexi bacterium]|nr:hypothetical protein [Chloroflexota bacterium]